MNDLQKIYSRSSEFSSLDAENLWTALSGYNREAAKLYWNLQAKIKGWDVSNHHDKLTDLMKDTLDVKGALQRIREQSKSSISIAKCGRL